MIKTKKFIPEQLDLNTKLNLLYAYDFYARSDVKRHPIPKQKRNHPHSHTPQENKETDEELKHSMAVTYIRKHGFVVDFSDRFRTDALNMHALRGPTGMLKKIANRTRN